MWITTLDERLVDMKTGVAVECISVQKPIIGAWEKYLDKWIVVSGTMVLAKCDTEAEAREYMDALYISLMDQDYLLLAKLENIAAALEDIRYQLIHIAKAAHRWSSGQELAERNVMGMTLTPWAGRRGGDTHA